MESAGTTVGPVTPSAGSYKPKLYVGIAASYDASGNWLATDTLNSGAFNINSNWAAGATGYLGFSVVDAASQPHYGWMQLTVPTTSAAGQNATPVPWGWESDADTPIPIPVPEIDPASVGSVAAMVVDSLGLLERQLGFTAGAAGLRAWRKRRQGVA